MGLDSVELLLSVEDHFGVSINDEIAGRLRTVGDLHEQIVKQLQEQGRFRQDADLVFADLRTLICEQLGVSSEKVTLQARFVEDLALD